LRIQIVVSILFCCSTTFAGDEALLIKGQRVDGGTITGGRGTWNISGGAVPADEVLMIRFSPEPPPSRMNSGVFIRGGSMLAGSLAGIVGDNADVSSSALGPLKLKRDDIAGAFSPLPSGQQENMPELARYCRILAATLGSDGSSLKPGKRVRVRFAGLDEVEGERVMRLGGEQILLSTKNKAVETINRQFVRLIELKVPDAPAAADASAGPEFIVRLKSGDLLRGRVIKLDDKSLTLQTTFMGEKSLERGMLAALFLAGGEGTKLNWLSAMSPAKAAHTPVFDAEFPHRMDCSVDGNDMILAGQPCERGIGVHSRSELQFTLPGTPARFITVCGIDAETRGRGSVIAKVLADGKELWKSKTVTGKDAPEIVSLDLGSAKTLTLQVDYADDDDSGDHFDWGWAAISK